MPRTTASGLPISALTTAILFSKDRPLQVDAALRSLNSCVQGNQPAVKVLFKATTPLMERLYSIAAREHPEAAFLPEKAFRTDLQQLVDNASELVMFVVDDTLFLRPFELDNDAAVLAASHDAIGLSLRLGKNTTYCYTMDAEQQVPNMLPINDRLRSYDWYLQSYDFGYPLELSSSVYRRDDVAGLLHDLSYRTPNTLEAALACVAPTLARARPRLLCYETSVAVSVPLNVVQTDYPNRAARAASSGSSVLAEAYARGDRADIGTVAGHVPRSAHEELELVLIRRPDVPTVSVVIPCFNQGRYLKEAIDSVVNQTYADWELIVVDDGSPDDTAAIVQSYIDSSREMGIQLIRQANHGLAAARNAGIAASKGRYILPLDADDRIDRGMLLACVSELEAHPEAAIAYTDMRHFGDSTRIVEAGIFDDVALPELNQLYYCSLYRAEVWQSVDGYSEAMDAGYEDWEFWVAALARGWRGRRISKPLFEYRVRPGTMSENAVANDARLRLQIKTNNPSVYTTRRVAVRAIRSRLRRVKDRSARAFRRLANVPVARIDS